MMKRYLLAICLGISFTTCAIPMEKTTDDRWAVLFDGKTLNGWFVHHGDLAFEVRNGEIIGATAVDIPTRYLTTEKQYGDFILELDMNNSKGENSGVQFRSVTDAPFYTGLTGYQLEVDPSERAWTGGIYFEGVGTWQHPPIGNHKCKAAWHKDDWNTLRIEARGETLRTFVNNTICAYLFDEYLSRGHIGLQIHSIGSNPEAAGAVTRWRNIRILENPQPEDFTPADDNADTNSHLVGRLSPIEEAKGWELALPRLSEPSLVRMASVLNPIDGTLWAVRVLELKADGPRSISVSIPEASYEFIANMQITPGTVGEILYPVVAINSNGEAVYCKASYRIFDDRSLDARDEDDPMLMGGLTGKIPARNLSESGRPKRVLYGDAWRRIGIKVHEAKVEHWLNAVKVVTYSGCKDAIASNETSRDVELYIEKGSVLFHTIKIQTKVD